MKKLFQLLAIVTPLALSLNTNAATFVVGDAAQDSTYTHAFTNGAVSTASHFDGSAWIDHMTFNLLDTSLVTITAYAEATALFLNTGSPDYIWIGGDTAAPLTLTTLLGAGSYQVDFKSENGIFHAGLQTASVAAVPEPETYALMLAGLALVGFTTRRRQA